MVFGLVNGYAVLNPVNDRFLPFGNPRFGVFKLRISDAPFLWKIPCLKFRDSRLFVYGRKQTTEFRSGDGFHSEPFWSVLIKETVRGFKSFLGFMIEQPSQLKYIEWPGFQNTLKTAILTLVLVALLIVVLSSIDSVLCYLLALFLRKSS